jgi:hypothetical protein
VKLPFRNCYSVCVKTVIAAIKVVMDMPLAVMDSKKWALFLYLLSSRENVIYYVIFEYIGIFWVTAVWPFSEAATELK